MPSLLVGASSSFVGEGEVGGSTSKLFTFIGTGSLVFSGTAGFIRVSHKTASGELAFESNAYRRATRATAGTFTFTGSTGKQYTKTYGGTITFGGTAGVAFSETRTVRTSSGGIAFSGTSEAFRSRLETGGQEVPGSYVGELYVGASPVGAHVIAPGLTFTGSASVLKIATKFASGSIVFTGNVGTSKHTNVTAIGSGGSVGLTFSGTAGLSVVGSGSAIWTGARGVGVGSAVDGSTVWELDDPDAVGASVSGSNVWSDSSTATGTVEGDGSIWK